MYHFSRAGAVDAELLGGGAVDVAGAENEAVYLLGFQRGGVDGACAYIFEFGLCCIALYRQLTMAGGDRAFDIVGVDPGDFNPAVADLARLESLEVDGNVDAQQRVARVLHFVEGG